MKRLSVALIGAALAASTTAAAMDAMSSSVMDVPSGDRPSRGNRKEHSNRHTGARKIQRAAKKRKARK